MTESLLTWDVDLFAGMSPTFLGMWLHSRFGKIDARPGECDV